MKIKTLHYKFWNPSSRSCNEEVHLKSSRGQQINSYKISKSCWQWRQSHLGNWYILLLTDPYNLQNITVINLPQVHLVKNSLQLNALHVIIFHYLFRWCEWITPVPHVDMQVLSIDHGFCESKMFSLQCAIIFLICFQSF